MHRLQQLKQRPSNARHRGRLMMTTCPRAIEPVLKDDKTFIYPCIQMAAPTHACRNESMYSLRQPSGANCEALQESLGRGRRAGRWGGQWRWHGRDGNRGGGSGKLLSGRAKEATPGRQNPTPTQSTDHSTALAT